MDEFIYDKRVTHKAVFFGPGFKHGRKQKRPKTALCKAVFSPDGCWEMIDQEICKRNWKSVTCGMCQKIHGGRMMHYVQHGRI